jgi:hypothetical protein
MNTAQPPEQKYHHAFNTAKEKLRESFNVSMAPNPNNPKGQDSDGLLFCGRPRILPLVARRWMPKMLYSFSFRPLTDGVMLAEGPTYQSNSDHWPGKTYDQRTSTPI